MTVIRKLDKIRSVFITLLLLCSLVMGTGCTTTAPSQDALSQAQRTAPYSTIERGNTPVGQAFGDWVVSAGGGLIQDAYVRGDDKLGVVISPQVPPNDVRPLARSLVQGFQRNAPQRNLTVLMYAPDKKLILTAKYDQQTRQIFYE